MKQRGDDKTPPTPTVAAFIILSLSSLITVTKQMNTTPSADDILGTSEKPKMLSLTAKSCPV